MVESRILPSHSLNEAVFSFRSVNVLYTSLFLKIFLRRLYSYITETLVYNYCMNIFTATAAKKIVMRLGVMDVTCLGQQQCLINKALHRTQRISQYVVKKWVRFCDRKYGSTAT